MHGKIISSELKSSSLKKMCLDCNAKLDVTSEQCPACTSAKLVRYGYEAQSAETAGGPAAGFCFEARFEIIEQLGEGSRCTVYKARQMEPERIVALKLMKLSASDAAEESIQRFLREGKYLCHLKHDNIAKFYFAAISSEQIPFCAMEYLPGQSLNKILETEKHLLPSRAIMIMRQICQALKCAHEAGIVQRNLQPSNIMLLDSPQKDTVKLSDFGLSIQRKQNQATAGLTKTGMIVGNLDYMSPEQCSGFRAEKRSDIYACGCLLYEMLTGEKPFRAQNSLALIDMHCNQAPSAFEPSAVGVELAAEIESICRKAMAKNPEDRYQNMDEFIHDLEVLESGKGKLIAGESLPEAQARVFKGNFGSSNEALSGSSSGTKPRVYPLAWIIFAFCFLGTCAIFSSWVFPQLSPSIKGKTQPSLPFKCKGVVCSLSLEPGVRTKINALQLITSGGIVKILGSARGIKDEVRVGDVLKIDYIGNKAGGTLSRYEKIKDESGVIEAINLVDNYCLFLGDQKYELALDCLDEKFIASHYAGLTKKQILEKFLQSYPPQYFVSKLHSYLELPQHAVIVSENEKNVKIMLNTLLLFRKSKGYLSFDLVRKADSGKWIIGDVHLDDGMTVPSLSTETEQLSAYLAKDPEFQIHKVRGTVIGTSTAPLSKELVELGLSGEQVRGVEFNTPDGIVDLRANLVEQTPAHAEFGSIWEASIKGTDNWSRELESYSYLGQDQDLVQGADLAEFYWYKCFENGFNPRPYLFIGSDPRIAELRSLHPGVQEFTIKSASPDSMEVKIGTDEHNACIHLSNHVEKLESKRFGSWKIRRIDYQHVIRKKEQ